MEALMKFLVVSIPLLALAVSILMSSDGRSARAEVPALPLTVDQVAWMRECVIHSDSGQPVMACAKHARKLFPNEPR